MSTDKNSTGTRVIFGPNKSYFALTLCLILVLFVNYFLYLQLQKLFKENLQERIISMASTAALNFDPNEISKISGPESIGSSVYQETVLKLNHIRQANKNVKYAYILRKTSDPNVLQFVADADSLDPAKIFDLNEDGKIDESDELNSPGDPYDISEFPWLRDEGFNGATVDSDLTQDQWGTFLSSSSPIYNSKGDTTDLIGLDVEVSDFIKITNAALVPYALFVVFLCLIITALTHFLVKTWKARVHVVQELDRQKDAVLHMVAHQFKGPVTTINFTTELLLDGTCGELTSEQKESISTIRTASQKMGAQSEMVLDAAKITLNKLPLNPVPTDLNELFKEVIEEAQNHAKQLKVHMKITLPNQTLPTAMLDRKYTQLAIDNLLSNAVKYTALKSEGGNVDFVVEMKNKTLFFHVKDTGIGIPKAEQDKIFLELYRASNAGKDGNGLGLRVARGAIEAQGGKMWFESEEGQGTTFFVELPLVVVAKK